jgi:predicted MFS family arabinose efflux permease
MVDVTLGAHGSAEPPVSVERGFQFVLLTLAATAALYARTAVSPLQETMRIALVLSDNQMALLQGPALALPMVIASVPLGVVIDRHSRVRLLLIFAGCALAANLLTALASHFSMLFAARCLSGLAVTAIIVAAYSILADLYSPEQRGRAGMVVLIGQFGGMAAAFALGGALVTVFGPGPNGWRWAMFWLTGPLVPVIFLMLAMREPVRTGVAIENPSAPQAFTELWQLRTVIVPLLAGLVMVETASGAALVWAAPTLSRRFALSPERVGAIMSMAVLVGGVLGSIAGGILADLCQRTGGPRRTISLLSGLALLSVLPAGLFAVVMQVGFATVLLVMFMAIVGAIIVAGVALFTIVIPNELRGLCLAAMVGANTLFGIALAPLAVSLLSGAIGGPVMIGKALALVCVAAGLLSAATLAFGRRYFPRTAVL